MKISRSKLIKKTKRLEIRPLELRDYQAWCEAYSEMREPQNEWDETNWDPKFLTKAAFGKLLRTQQQERQLDRGYAFGVFRRDDGRLIGSMGLWDVSRGRFQNAYIGYRIFNSYWMYGYGAEAVEATCEIGFRSLNLHRIEAGIQPENKNSIALAKKIGLRKEGLSSKRLFYKNRWVDLILYVATAEDFKIKYRFPK